MATDARARRAGVTVIVFAGDVQRAPQLLLVSPRDPIVAGNGTISSHRQDAERRVRPPHRNPTSPGRGGVPPQVPHRHDGIPRHTAAHLLRWPRKPVTSLYADQAG